ncbi:MAG: RIP metalloprotease RseP [Gemmatimonadota bacterium]
MQTFLLTVLVLGLLVFVHELGHFMTAKWAGIAVPRFSIGLGPRVVGFRWGETDYCLSAVPFGGYVKLAGMEGEEAFEKLEGGADEQVDDSNVPPERRFDNKPIRWRLLVISAGVIMNFLLGWLIYVFLAFGEGIPTTKGARVAGVDSVALARFPALQPLADGGVEIAAVDGQPVANWYEIDRALQEARGGAAEIALADGRTIEVPVPEDDAGGFAAGLLPLTEPLIVDVEGGSPAALAGIQAGDRIVAIDGEEVASFADVVEFVRDRPDQRMPVQIERPGEDGEPERLSLTVQTGSEQTPRASDGKFIETGWLGVTAETETVELGPIEALSTGTRTALQASTLIVGGLYQLVTGNVSVRSLGGPVAIGQLTGRFARRGWQSLVGWIALFSINLAILNLLPIPVLDGGHILFLAIEASRGRPLSARQKLRLSQVGLAFLVLLMALAFTSDMLRLIGL